MPANPSSLILFARVPEPGRVKTRLAPLLTEAGAARIYLSFLEDAARAYAYGCPASWSPVLAADPDPDDPRLAPLFPAPWRRERQASGDLGERLFAAFEEEFARGARRVIAVGSDHPALPRRLVEEAFASLSDGREAVVIPAEDGGYCAIGLTAAAPAREVFRDIPWSTFSVLSATRERMSALGLNLTLLESAYDVDRPEDLDRLRRDLERRDPAAPDYPRSTARALRALFPNPPGS